MNRGISFVDDMKSIINDPNYSDLKLICSDGSVLYGSRIHLAARSECFDRLLYNGMRESGQYEIKFPEVSSAGMKVVLEFLYIGSIDANNLTTQNAIDAFQAANYFLLTEMEYEIMKLIQNYLARTQNKEKALELFSLVIEKINVTEKNGLFRLLVKYILRGSISSLPVPKITLNMLKILLTQKFIKVSNNEYEIFRYIVIWGTYKISPKISAFYERILTVPSDSYRTSPVGQQYKDPSSFIHLPKPAAVIKEVAELLTFIDLKRIPIEFLANFVHPLGIFEPSRISEAYQFHAIINAERRVFNYYQIIYYQWEPSICKSRLLLTENNTVVEATVYSAPLNDQGVRAQNIISGKGIYQWHVVIERRPQAEVLVGVCGVNVENYSTIMKYHKDVWLYSIYGYLYHDNESELAPLWFTEGDTVTVHLNMYANVCSFLVNGINISVVFQNLPDRLYPVVVLNPGARIRIQSHK
ncbi:4880_t:CDS:1 [Ambispora gerdemannii]|uniref:4880_t:CDS:1 n=1 Tax=Ambispora gerdemannii TaxID=144530 RepID=A0A9N8WU00_9GLOM|nr:4880_t:CDS:1 [Ambispora gerdemannii]